MRHAPTLLTVFLGAIAVACAWVAVQVAASSARDAWTGGGPGVRVEALTMLVVACLLGALAWRLLMMARLWLGIARRTAQVRAASGDHRDRTP